MGSSMNLTFRGDQHSGRARDLHASGRAPGVPQAIITGFLYAPLGGCLGLWPIACYDGVSLVVGAKWPVRLSR